MIKIVKTLKDDSYAHETQIIVSAHDRIIDRIPVRNKDDLRDAIKYAKRVERIALNRPGVIFNRIRIAKGLTIVLNTNKRTGMTYATIRITVGKDPDEWVLGSRNMSKTVSNANTFEHNLDVIFSYYRSIYKLDCKRELSDNRPTLETVKAFVNDYCDLVETRSGWID